MIEVTHITDVFAWKKDRRLVHRPDGTTPRELLLEELDAEPIGLDRYQVIVNGRRVELDEPLARFDHIVAAKLPDGPLFVFLVVYTLIVTAISIGLSFIINALIGPPDSPQQDGPDGSNTYGFRGIQNTRTGGTPIPITYGEHRVGGQILQLYRRNERSDADTGSLDPTRQFLFMVIGLGRGQLQQIGDYTTDQNALTAGGKIFIDKFDDPPLTSADSLQDRDGWQRQGASPADAFRGVSLGAGDYAVEPDPAVDSWALVFWRDTIGLTSDNVRIQFKLLNDPSGVMIAGAINTKDHDNCHYVRRTSATNVRLVARVAGSNTTLGNGTSSSFSDIIDVRRDGDVIQVRAGGTIIITATADPALNHRRVGIIRASGTAGTLGQLDDFNVDGIRQLPDFVHINGNEANTYDHIIAWTRLGRPGQAKLPEEFSQVIQGYRVDLPLFRHWTKYRFRNPVEGFQLVFEFPRGLYDGSGGFTEDTVRIEVEYREHDEDAWQSVPGSPFTYTHALTTAFARTAFWEPDPPLTGDAQAIRYRRKDPIRNATDPAIQDIVRIGDINEILRADRQHYDDIALIALRVEAQENLHGALPNVTTLLRGVPCPTWDGTTTAGGNEAIVYQYSTNPAWVALNILLDAEHGLGNQVKLGDVDMASWKTWADWCDEQLTYAEAFDEPEFTTNDTEAVAAAALSVVIDGDDGEYAVLDFIRVELESVNQITGKTDLGGGRFQLDLAFPVLGSYPARWNLHRVELGEEITDTRCTFNGTFDSDISVWDAVLRVCRTGRAMPVREGSKWRVRFEDADPVDQTITEANIVKDSLEISYVGGTDRPDIIEAQYLDEAADYDQLVAIAAGFGIDPTRQPKRQTVNLYGVTNARQARREANYRLRTAKLLRKRIKFEATLDAIAVQKGDVLRLGLTMPGWASHVMRARGTTAAIILERDFTIDADFTYTALIRNGDDRAGTAHTVTTVAGAYIRGDTIATDASPAEDLDADATIVFYRQDTTPTLWRVLGVTLTSALTARVDAIEYNPDIYLLPGWPGDGCETIPAPGGGCLPPGCYVVNLDDLGLTCTHTPPPSCDPPSTQCFQGTVNIAITGAASPCVSILQTKGAVITIEVLPGCEGDEFCIEVTTVGSWICCPGPCEPPCSHLSDCSILPQTACWTICASAFANGFDEDAFHTTGT